MKYFILTIWLSYSCFLHGQNLVPNPGFDMISQCPFDFGQIDLAFPWITANNGTPDLYNECSNIQHINVPYAGRYIDSYQIQRSGGGYAGIVVYADLNFAPNEYIECPLQDELIADNCYYIEFYVSPDVTSTTLWQYTDAIGLAFSDSMYYIDLYPFEAIPLIPAIENRGNLITDTVDWTRISGCYIAKGGEKFAIIGNFRNYSETQIVVEDPGGFGYVSYFYIEDVFIAKFDPLPDTILLCGSGDERLLNAKFIDGTYLWNTGATDSILVVNAPGIYTVEVFMPNCVLRDTVIVLESDEYVYFPDDTLACENEALTLTAPIYGNYEWSDGSNNRSTTIHQEGMYYLSITNECGSYFFETEVIYKACACDVYVPNIFTPNDDGINETISLNFSCDFEYDINSFAIFDRWGNQVYSAKGSQQVDWNGVSTTGVRAQNGVYIWLLDYSVVIHGEIVKKQESGSITLLN